MNEEEAQTEHIPLWVIVALCMFSFMAGMFVAMAFFDLK